MQVIIFSVLIALVSGEGPELSLQVSQSGLDGSVTFSAIGDAVVIVADLKTEDSWTWSVQEFPVDYSKLSNRCSDDRLGKVLLDLSLLLGEVNNATQVLNANKSSLPLIGDNGVWSRSVLFKSGQKRACATIMGAGGGSVKVAEAKFAGQAGVKGRIMMQWLGSAHFADAVLFTDLSFTTNKLPEAHNWRIYTTDILDSEADKARSDCNSLQVILLDLTARLGPALVGGKALIRDQFLPYPDLASRRRNHYLVLIDNAHPDTFLTCTRLVLRPPTLLRGIINGGGVSGSFSAEQGSVLVPSKVELKLDGVQPGILGGFRIHHLPARPPLGNTPRERCLDIGDVFNPLSKPVAADAPFPGEESQDMYAVGDISGKLGYTATKKWDSFLPLQGEFSIFFRTFVLYRNGENGEEEPWLCTTLLHYENSSPERKIAMLTAEAIYRYPLVGRMLFYQRPGPGEEVTILSEGMVHADGTTLESSVGHRWGIAENPPGADFFNWTARCVSAGPLLNPDKVDVNKSAAAVLGALSDRHAPLTIAGAKSLLQISREIWVDNAISLQGSRSVLGKSLVIFDDFGPKARGDRLACSKITSVFRRKAVARDWFGNGVPTPVSGKIEFFELNEYTTTDVELLIEGLHDITSYSINVAPVLEMLEFPCEETTLYGIYSPEREAPSLGNEKTVDIYPAGDLSSKFGLLPPVHATAAYNDSTLLLYGQKGILGRSLVLYHYKTKTRLACATIERGYAPSEAREIRAIASFHHPEGFAYGYIRMTQLIHFDGSSSETVMEVNLRHPGKQDKNLTRGHNWAIYVNPVGVDAAVKILHTRCTAAGYIWNPYYTQLADPLNDKLYRQECGPDLPLRCYVGDLSGRLGPIDLGAERRVFSDPNFPLEGKVSAMGKSIVILNKEGGHEKFACANIEPDYDTVKFVNLRRTPKFVVSAFLEDIREVMGIPDWYLTIDSRKTNILFNGACVQLFVHFKGPQANKLEQDFSRLLASGRLDAPSLWIPGYIPKKKRPVTTGHKLCPTGYSALNSPVDNQDVFGSPSASAQFVISYFVITVCILASHIF